MSRGTVEWLNFSLLPPREPTTLEHGGRTWHLIAYSRVQDAFMHVYSDGVEFFVRAGTLCDDTCEDIGIFQWMPWQDFVKALAARYDAIRAGVESRP